MLNEIGYVSVVGSKTNSSAPTADDVLALVWGDGSDPIIKSSVHVASPKIRVTVGGCGIEKDEVYHLYFATEDDEDPPNTASAPLYRFVHCK